MPCVTQVLASFSTCLKIPHGAGAHAGASPLPATASHQDRTSGQRAASPSRSRCQLPLAVPKKRLVQQKMRTEVEALTLCFSLGKTQGKNNS